jgi:hypothetical protein
MTSHSVQVHGHSDRHMAPVKKLWTKPSVEIIALEDAEAGRNPVTHDGAGGHATRPRS